MRHDRFEGFEALDDFRAHHVMTLVAVMLAGSVGVGLRHVLDIAVTARAGDGFPWSTLVVNVAGAFALGVVVAVLAGQPSGSLMRASLGIGLLGGFTTFSAFALESVSLFEDGLIARAVLYVGATNILGIGATVAGLVTGRTWSG